MIRSAAANAPKVVSKSARRATASPPAGRCRRGRCAAAGAPGNEPAPLNAIAPPRVRVKRTCGRAGRLAAGAGDGDGIRPGWGGLGGGGNG